MTEATADDDSAPAETSGGRRAFWTFFDQALSSLTNAALAIVVARAVSKGDFGAFSLALVTFSFVIGIGRGLISDPFVVRYSDAGRNARRAATAAATGAGLTYGVVSGAVCAVAGLMIDDHHLRLALFALALSLPGLMLQDVWRHVFFAAGRPAHAAFNDGVWTVVQFVLLGVLLASGNKSVFLITLAWGLAALVAGVAGFFQTRILPAPTRTIAWLQETKDLNVRMALDFVLNMGAVNLAIYVVGGLVGLAGVGALRAAQVLLGPLNLLYAGASSFILPVLSRLAGANRSLIRTSALASAATGGIAGTWVLILLVIPPDVGHMLLGDSWEGARSVMLGSGLVAIAVGFVIGASLGLKGLRRADQMLRVTFLQAPFMLGLGALGAVTDGEVGASYGFAVAQIFGMIVCWVIFVRVDGRPRDWIGQEPTGPITAPTPSPALAPADVAAEADRPAPGDFLDFPPAEPAARRPRSRRTPQGPSRHAR